VIVKGLNWSSLIVGCLLAAVAINATMAFFAIVVPKWSYFWTLVSLQTQWVILFVFIDFDFEKRFQLNLTTNQKGFQTCPKPSQAMDFYEI